MSIHNARWWQIHLNNLLYSGRDFEGEDEWIGTQEQWNKVSGLEQLCLEEGLLVE
jgi:hypothetical protein